MKCFLLLIIFITAQYQRATGFPQDISDDTVPFEKKIHIYKDSKTEIKKPERSLRQLSYFVPVLSYFVPFWFYDFNVEKNVDILEDKVEVLKKDYQDTIVTLDQLLSFYRNEIEYKKFSGRPRSFMISNTDLILQKFKYVLDTLEKLSTHYINTSFHWHDVLNIIENDLMYTKDIKTKLMLKLLESEKLKLNNDKSTSNPQSTPDKNDDVKKPSKDDKDSSKPESQTTNQENTKDSSVEVTDNAQVLQTTPAPNESEVKQFTADKDDINKTLEENEKFFTPQNHTERHKRNENEIALINRMMIPKFEMPRIEDFQDVLKKCKDNTDKDNKKTELCELYKKLTERYSILQHIANFTVIVP